MQRASSGQGTYGNGLSLGDSLSSFFSFTLSVTHTTAVVFPGNSFQIFPPEIQQGANASEIFYLELLSTTPNPGNFSRSIEIVRYI